MNYKIYGLTEPGKDKLSDIIYVGVTTKSLKKRLSGHSSIQPGAMHTPLKKWVMGLRDKGQRPNIILICEVDHCGYARFLESFFCFRLSGMGNSLLNSTAKNIWGYLKKSGARTMAKKFDRVTTLQKDDYESLRDYYFRNLGTVEERNNYKSRP